MHLLGFSFPPDYERTTKTIGEIPIDYMLRIKSEFEDNYSYYLAVFESLRSRIVFTYCDVCDEQEVTYDDIPDGWGWYDGQVKWYMMCTACQKKYKDKFGKQPIIVTDI